MQAAVEQLRLVDPDHMNNREDEDSWVEQETEGRGEITSRNDQVFLAVNALLVFSCVMNLNVLRFK